MKKIALIGKKRHVGNIMIVMQGILITLLTILFINSQYITAWKSYPDENGAFTVYLKDIPNEKQSNVETYLLDTIRNKQLFILRSDMGISNNGSFTGFKVGVYGDVNENQVSLDFLNQSILNSENLSTLLSSDNPASTLGVDQGSVDSVGELPYFRFFEKVVVKKLPQLISESETINGTYKIVGITTDQDKQQFVAELSKVSGVSEKALSTEMSGTHLDDSFKRDILLILLAAQIFSNLVFFVVTAVKSLDRQGKLVLLGWSRRAFAKEILGGFFMSGLISVPFLIVLGYLLAGWNQFTPLLISFFALIICFIISPVSMNPNTT